MSKPDLFDNRLQLTTMLFKAFSHPARLAIIELIYLEKECAAGRISEKLPLSRTTVNQHLNELRNMGLIISQNKGVNIIYSLNFEKLEKADENINDFLKTFK